MTRVCDRSTALLGGTCFASGAAIVVPHGRGVGDGMNDHDLSHVYDGPSAIFEPCGTARPMRSNTRHIPLPLRSRAVSLKRSCSAKISSLFPVTVL